MQPSGRKFAELILMEKMRQIEKHGFQDGLPDIESVFVTAEEFGEYIKDANEVHYRRRNRTEMETELVQTAACLFRHWERSIARTDAR